MRSRRRRLQARVNSWSLASGPPLNVKKAPSVKEGGFPIRQLCSPLVGQFY